MPIIPSSKHILPSEIVMSFELYMMMPLLKRVALNALARKVHASKYRQLFCSLDTTESGTLTKAEFMTGFSRSGMSPDELLRLFQALDVNQNGEILYTEFIAATLEAEGKLSTVQLREAFDQIDESGSGCITKKALTKMLGNTLSIKQSVCDILDDKEHITFDCFEELFQHGFDAGRSIDTIAESKNETAM
eukprot:CAMPEP_0119550200 /NCGR_PEP_ID=MMETSP1352-20130426/3755_1 /TAXON_ID=265584 /ORGANISM="Stauroneis constricta, Strain CCMP1120" /LENGTH=190 /DNA_ID=CAMNT_0007595969 /DNA_START=37 /DNA_END=609 /DNA_ORIENTATION=+